MGKEYGWKGPTFRLARALKYLALIIAASVTFISPSNIIFGVFQRIPFFIYFWSILLLIAASCCFYGIVRKKWVGEFVGLPGIIACLFLYAIGCFADTPALTLQRVFLGFILFAFTASSVARKQDINFQKRVAEYENRVKEGRPGL